MKRYKYITSIGIITIVLSLSSFSILSKDQKVSDLEKRTLQVIPTFSNLVNEEKSHNFNAYIYELLNGNIFENWDKYFSDHISLRGSMVNVFNNIQGFLDKKYMNNAILGKENYIFSFPKIDTVLNETQLENRANYFNEIAKEFKDSKVYMVNLPSKDMIYNENIPIDQYKSLKNDYINKIWSNLDSNLITKLDFTDVANKKENLYYKTDHHWNMEGVYNGYKYIIEKLSDYFPTIKPPNSKDYYNIKKYENCFIGSDGSKVPSILKEKDDVEIYKYKNEDDYKILINGEESNFFNEELLNDDKKNRIYHVYLNGDPEEIIVKNLKSNNKINMVMISDSMDNPLVSLMADNFNTLYSYDLRFYKGNIINKIKEINPDIVMLIGISDNFINEKSLIFKMK